ncbi:hypothetical protein GGP41_000672 [Bipolaris sorokiniana]|uniref:Uncharacterized protein n=1 Tax=Cochliobolus sativus TaxID=45130 RepID=A0A8H6DZ61_COCSA|nr:hypothetical protein GGP41_000672 [Bipolaris sorokiniana]
MSAEKRREGVGLQIWKREFACVVRRAVGDTPFLRYPRIDCAQHHKCKCNTNPLRLSVFWEPPSKPYQGTIPLMQTLSFFLFLYTWMITVVSSRTTNLCPKVGTRVYGNHQYLSQPPIQDSTALRMRCRSIARYTENAHQVIPKHTGASNDTEWASAWVGISDSNFESQLQGGVNWAVERSGKVSYTAWYEGFSYETSCLDNFNVTGGDVIQVDIVTTSVTTGNVRLINVNTSNNISMDVTAPPDSFLADGNAEWIIEDFSAGGRLPLADFGSVVFTNASAKVSTGWVEDLRGATIIKMVLEDKLVADSVIDSLSQIAIKYVE